MYTWKRDTLTNGLRVVTIEVPHLHSVMASIYVRAGSRHETREINGVSHFLEHLLFRGCDDYPSSRSLNGAVEMVGGSLNGVTTREHCYYYTQVHPEGVPQVLRIAAKMLATPLLKDIEIEREVILEEILDEVDEEGRIIDVDTISKEIVFQGHPLSFPIAGDRDSVQAIQERDLRRHHSTYYDAEHLVLCVAGPVRHDRMMREAEVAFGHLPSAGRAPDTPPPVFSGGPRLRLVTHKESQSQLRLTFPAHPEQHPDYAAQSLLLRILDDGLTSRLQQEVVEARGLAYDVGAGVDLFSDCALLEIDAGVTHGKAPALLEAVKQTLGRLVQEPPSEEELTRVKTRVRYGFDFMHDSAADLVGWFGLGEMNDALTSLEERLERVLEVRAEDVRRVAGDLFRPEGMLAVVVGLADEDALESALRASW